MVGSRLGRENEASRGSAPTAQARVQEHAAQAAAGLQCGKERAQPKLLQPLTTTPLKPARERSFQRSITPCPQPTPKITATHHHVVEAAAHALVKHGRAVADVFTSKRHDGDLLPPALVLGAAKGEERVRRHGVVGRLPTRAGREWTHTRPVPLSLLLR